MGLKLDISFEINHNQNRQISVSNYWYFLFHSFLQMTRLLSTKEVINRYLSESSMSAPDNPTFVLDDANKVLASYFPVVLLSEITSISA